MFFEQTTFLGREWKASHVLVRRWYEATCFLTTVLSSSESSVL